ncbi:Replication protein A 14 kDa subunit [Schistosoma japonicum]|uniref:Replication protein A 14 kDa subunit n=1 Tax=Schistosoma japonicum TaxID=6182 RepID=A0A4Z2DL38_SCHJA|nr:Replication protein A 14 kDa subunit [Schistosoma japonicum]
MEASEELFQDFADQKPIARFRVTGSMLPNLVGRDVCIVGTVLRVSPSGQKVHMRCVDGREIDCNLLSPLQTSPENRVIEVQGRVSNVQGTEINATAEVIVFSQEASAKFDSELYSQAIQMTAQFDQFYIQPMEA